VDGAITYPGLQPAFAAVLAVFLLGEAIRGRQVAGLILVVGSGQLGGASAPSGPGLVAAVSAKSYIPHDAETNRSWK
jgi:drug/metabolite transporter (DMT)-like permease